MDLASETEGRRMNAGERGSWLSVARSPVNSRFLEPPLTSRSLKMGVLVLIGVEMEGAFLRGGVMVTTLAEVLGR